MDLANVGAIELMNRGTCHLCFAARCLRKAAAVAEGGFEGALGVLKLEIHRGMAGLISEKSRRIGTQSKPRVDLVQDWKWGMGLRTLAHMQPGTDDLP
jgi:hypothetical protein